MKVLTVVGARPQFVKAAAVSRELRRRHDEMLIHTGQHYDEEMSDVFFDELGIPEPDDNLGVGSSNHSDQTAEMLAGLGEKIDAEDPDAVLVYGDTNSTLAAAIAAAKMDTDIAHVEAGLRSYNRSMPEEINRVLTDHAADLLFAPSRRAVENLREESVPGAVHNTGDVMYDAVLWARDRAENHSEILDELGVDISWTVGPESTGPAFHHMGTTRMGADASESVVNPQLRTHDLRNLSVASSSVFRTGGALNPTLTIAALSLKMADHVDERL